ncbi:hypothetical protein [Fibrella aquatica]|uniref:hypothetical protein n=1 Tax=Fibrella aquatica TaxID=3242487 RepID=UPI00352123F6
MKKTLPKFLLAQNDLAMPGQQYIVHTQRPAFCARALSFPNEAAIETYLDEHSPTYAVMLEQMPVLLEVVEFWGSPSDLKPAVLKRMGHWYYQTTLKPTLLFPTLPPTEPSLPS